MVWIFATFVLCIGALVWFNRENAEQLKVANEHAAQQSEANIRLMAMTIQETVGAVSRELYGERSEIEQPVMTAEMANMYKSMWDDPLPDEDFDPATYLEPEMEPEGRVAFGPQTNGTNPLVPGPSVPHVHRETLEDL